MANMRQLTKFEYDVMKILWKKKKASVRQVWKTLYPANEKAYTTVKTVLDRLVTKQMIKKEKDGLVNIYTPIISKQHSIRKDTERLIKRAFDNSSGLLAEYLIESFDLEKSDLQRIKKIIKLKEEQVKNDILAEQHCK